MEKTIRITFFYLQERHYVIFVEIWDSPVAKEILFHNIEAGESLV